MRVPLTSIAARVRIAAAWGTALAALLTPRVQAEEPVVRPSLAVASPQLHRRMVGIERAHGVYLGALVSGNGRVDESAVLGRMRQRLSAPGDTFGPDPEAERGLDALGREFGATVRRAYAFHRDVLAVFVATPPADRRSVLDLLLADYQRQPQALPSFPKDLTILYDHPFTSFVAPGPGQTEPSRRLAYPRLTGATWTGHWYGLAVSEALERASDARDAEGGLALVADRFARKLSGTTLPDANPTELPLAPSIAPGLVAVHERSAAVLDNLHLLLDVAADLLVHPSVRDRRAAAQAVLREFRVPDYRCVRADDWITVALRHSIFEQGGPAVGELTRSERNSFFGAHAQHFGPRRLPPSCLAP